jgi:hypothetical protein
MAQHSAANVAELTAAQAEAKRLRDALVAIKQLVIGERRPNWSDHHATTQTRVKIADLCDAIYQS